MAGVWQMSEKRILVVDDEPDIIELLRDYLGGEGFAVDGALDATGALNLIREQIYDAAILDFNLRDMNGIMLHRQIRQLDPELAEHALFASGLVQSDENLGYFDAQGSEFLSKPFELAAVLQAVRAILGQD